MSTYCGSLLVESPIRLYEYEAIRPCKTYRETKQNKKHLTTMQRNTDSTLLQHWLSQIDFMMSVFSVSGIAQHSPVLQVKKNQINISQME